MNLTKEKIKRTRKTVKMDNNTDQWYELGAKFLWGLFYILVGFIGKIAQLINHSKQKIGWMEFFASFGVALFVGYMTYVYCEYMQWEERIKWAVPLATYLSDKLSIILLRINKVDWRTLMTEWMDSFKKNSNGNE